MYKTSWRFTMQLKKFKIIRELCGTLIKHELHKNRIHGNQINHESFLVFKASLFRKSGR